MTVSITDYRSSFAGNGSTTGFTIPFRFDTDAEIKATLFTSAGVGTVQTITTHYTLSGAGADSGGSCEMVTAPASGETLLIERVSAGQQNVDLVAGGALSAESVEDALDQRVMASQEHRGELARAIKLHPLDADTDMTLPLEADRANKVLAFGANGEPEAGPTGDEVSNAQTYSTAAAASAASAAADAVLTAADVVSTNADVVSAEAARDAALAASESMAWGYEFDTGTADADPGSAAMRFNHATFSSATFLYINETADEGSIADLMDLWDGSTSVIKATARIRNPLTNDWYEFQVTGAITDAGAYRKIPITPAGSNGSIADGTAIKFQVIRNGDAGTGAVDSFNGRTGPVSPASGDYTKDQVGLGNADNTSDADKPVSTAQQAALDKKRGFANRLINPLFRVDIEGNASGTTADASHVVEGWVLYHSNGVTAQTLSRVAGDSVPYALQYEVTTGSDTSIGAAEYAIVETAIEGVDLADALWGTADAKNIVISGRIKAPTTGTYSVAVRNGAVNRSYVFEIACTASTWVDFEKTVPGDTSGTWDITNGVGLRLAHAIACGSDYHATADTWQGTADFATSNQENGLSSNGNQFEIEAVSCSVEKGAPVGWVPYVEELARCHRYFQSFHSLNAYEHIGQLNWISATRANCVVHLFQEMRADPTFSVSAASDFTASYGSGSADCSAIAADQADSRKFNLQVDISGGSTAGFAGAFYRHPTNTNGKLDFDARMI